MKTLSYEPLTPISFLDRAALAHGERTAVVDGGLSFTYTELHQRVELLAGAIHRASRGRPVAMLLPNSHMALEMHFAVPMSGVPLVPVNTRLSSPEIAHIIGHSEAGVLLYDESLRRTAEEVLETNADVRGILCGAGDDDQYEQFLAGGSGVELPVLEDELAVISINYTSGTTGAPKGVLYQHRGAYLQALAMIGHTGLSTSSVYLWTLPMFHCNGWTFPWAVTAVGATHVCQRGVDPDAAWHAIRELGVTHLCGAPTVLTMLAYSGRAADGIASGTRAVNVMTGGAPPSPAILSRMKTLGFEVTHLYGLTETYGPAVVCEWRPEWDDLDEGMVAQFKARQGVANLVSCTVRLLNDAGDVPADGTTIGEIAMRGNNVMLGYHRDAESTAAASPDGWFRTGDLGVLHQDGYIEIRDRAKDVIVSGGENISSVEVENAIASHPAVREVAVVSSPSSRWGETPAAYIALHPGATLTPEEVTAHVRERLAGYKVPRKIIFGELPHTSTGKVQKFALRRREWRFGAPN